MDNIDLPSNNNADRKISVLYRSIINMILILIPLIFFTGAWIKLDIDRSRNDYIFLLENSLKNLSSRLDNYLNYYTSALLTLKDETFQDGFDKEKFNREASYMLQYMKDWSFFSVYDVQNKKFLIEDDIIEKYIGKSNYILNLDHTASLKGTYYKAFVVNGNIKEDDFIIVNIPVFRDGAVHYILSGGIKLDGIQQLVNPAYKNYKAVRQPAVISIILTRDGQYIARSPENPLIIGDIAPGFSKTDLTDTKLAELIHANKQFSQYMKTVNGENLYIGYYISPLTKWLTIAVKKEDNFYFLRKSMWSIVLTSAIGIIMIGIFVIFLNYRFLQKQAEAQKQAAFEMTVDLKNKLIETTQKNLETQKQLADQKEMLLREAYHRIKNNLMAIQSLMVLSARGLPEEQREPFMTAARQLTAMSKVHTMLYMTTDVTSINFNEYLETIVTDTAQLFNDENAYIKIELDAPEQVTISSKKAVPLAFIVVEIITNASKHAFPESKEGMISISITKSENFGILKISDNGVGFPEKVNSRKSMGMRIIAGLVEQIDGIITLPKPGSSDYKIVFPL